MLSQAIDSMCKNEAHEKKCEENLQRDLETCAALGKRNRKTAYKIFEQQAMVRYGNCLSNRDEGIDAPLLPWSSSSKTKRALLVSLVKHKGELRLSLDDVESQDGSPAVWKQTDHYTSKPVTEAEIEELKLDEKDLADFGYHILARLYAFKRRGEI